MLIFREAHHNRHILISNMKLKTFRQNFLDYCQTFRVWIVQEKYLVFLSCASWLFNYLRGVRTGGRVPSFMENLNLFPIWGLLDVKKQFTLFGKYPNKV